MKFFNKLTIFWLTSMLYFQLGTVKSLSDESVYSDERAPLFNHLAIHKNFGTIFLGAVNRLFKLSADLKFLDNITTISNSRLNNYNEILVINYWDNSLMACGYTDKFLCQTYSASSVGKLTRTGEINVEGMLRNRSNVPVAALIADNNGRAESNGFLELYFAVSYGGYSIDFSAMTIEKFKVGSMLGMYGEDYRYHRDAYKVNYLYGFNSNQYSYFLTTQLQSRDHGSPYISKIIRICFDGQSLWRGYAEIPIECKFEGKNTYNLIQAATVGKPTAQLAISLNISTADDVLYAVFSKSRDENSASNDPSDFNALCIYSLKTINEKFVENIEKSFNGNGFRGFGNILDPQSHKTNEYIDMEFCSSPVNMSLIGKQPIASSPIHTFTTQLTAIVIKLSEDYNEVFIGTNKGRLKRIVIKDVNRVCELADLQIHEQSPINSDLLFSPDNNYLYVMTEHKLTRIKTPEGLVDCSIYEDFDTCFETVPKYCGWCAPLSKCTTKCDCFYEKNNWQSNNFEKHVRFIKTRSNEFQIGAVKLFLIRTAASLELGTRFTCEYIIENRRLISYGDFHSEGFLNAIRCPVPGKYDFPKITTDRNYFHTTLSILTFQNEKIDTKNMKFFDCGIYTTYETCNQSTFECVWCLEKKECIYTAPRIQIKINPIKTTSQIINIPSGVHSILNITDVSVNICDEAYLECAINIEGNWYTRKAKIENCSSISCESTLFKYAKNSSYIFANVTIMRANLNFRDILFDTRVLIYKCQLMAYNHSTCRSLNPVYECKWCQRTNTCEFRANCTNQVRHQNISCPRSSSPSISSFWPLQGPVEGGTNVTIVGENLGCKFEDISQGITVVGIACTPFREKYITAKSITCAIGKIELPKVHEGSVEVSINGIRIKSSRYFKFVAPELESISPNKGPTYGGTIVTILGKNLDIGSSANVVIGNASCLMISCNSSSIKCISNASCTESEAKIYVEYDNNRFHLTSESFTYFKDPERDNNGYYIEFVGIPAGGVEMLLRNVTILPTEQLIFYAHGEKQVYNSTCKLRRGSNSTWSCLSPLISEINKHPDDVTYPIQMNVSFTSNLTNSKALVDLINQSRKFTLYPNPKFHHFLNSSVQFNENKYVIIAGKDIDKACQKTDIIVKLGNHNCKVISISSGQVVCSLPKYLDVSNQEYDILAQYDNISVLIGENFCVIVKKQQSSSDKITEKPPTNPFILYGIIIFVIIVLIAAISFLISEWKMVAISLKKLRQTKQQMTRLELRVASECKEAFAELQTRATTSIKDDSYTHFPFLSFHTYTMNILFSKNDDHSFILNGKTILIHKEKGLHSFRELIMNKKFLLLFVRTLEKEKSFAMSDRVFVASMIMITLQKDMEYCTDILQTLLAELIDKYMRGNFHPKLLLRKTESVVEKMLSAWFSFLLYEFLKESAGPPMFNLFTAIKEHVNQGPVDMVTSQARYCLSENKLLRHKFEFSSMTIHVNIPLQTAKIIGLETPIEDVPVQVLDCDTISQFKEKALDAIHRTINYSRNVNSAELNVEWICDTSIGKILSDDDLSSVTDGEWRQKNTLRHYGVRDGSVLNLISKTETNRASASKPILNKKKSLDIIKYKPTSSFRKIRKKSLTESTAALIPGNDPHFKEWHLFKPDDTPDGHEDRGGSHEMMPEIYLPRLLATKSSLQKFVDELFDVIFKKSNQISCFPVAIKYMFDFLDDQARQHNITDPEVVHVWKNNCLPLRFWANLIKNPNFLFHIHKSHIVDSCLSVIAQVFMDSCSTSEQHFNKDSATTKLLYAKEIPVYNNVVQKYYADIKSMPRISSQDMKSMLSDESKKYVTDFDTNVAVDELFKYALKYREKLIESLKQDGSSEHNVLLFELRKTISVMSAQTCDVKSSLT